MRDIHNRHGSKLTVLLDALAVARHQRLRSVQMRPERSPGLPRLGPLESVVSGHTNLTIVTEWMEAGWFTREPTVGRTCVSIVIAGHSRGTGIRAQLPLVECDAWMASIVDKAWREHVYRCAEPGKRAEYVSIASYKIFLDEDQSPSLKPDEQGLESYIRLSSDLS